MKKRFSNFIIFICFIFFSLEGMAKEKDIAKGYTINFNEVKITEYIKFISKICDLNFIFQEKDLNFTITIISEHPIQKEDLMSTLIQTLRIHGFYLLENKEGIVIHKSTNVKQMPQIISQDEEITGYPPIITKIFQLKNIQVDIINNIIKSMISEEAILESIPQTNQIILTDIARNIQEISHFINEIDNSKSPLKIQIYSVASQIPIETLVSTTTQILTPLTGTNTLLLIPQNETKSIYMVASSYVLEECMMILTMLDESYKTKKILTADNIFLYTPTHKSIDFILTSLKKFTSNLSQLGFQEDLLNTTIKDSQVIEKTNSLLFISSKETTSQLKEILAILDVPTKEETDIASESFFIYSAKNLSSENLYKALLQIKENLKTLGLEKKSIYNSLEKVKIIEKPNVLMITGSKNTFEEIKDLLTSLDTEINANLKNANSFLIFTIKNSVDQQLLSTIKEINDNLKISTDIKDKELTHSLDNLKYLSKIHSLFIIGNESTLKEVDSLLTSLDSLQLTEGSAPSKNSNFLIYKPHYQSSEFISKYLKDIATNLEDSHLSDPHLIQSIQKMKVISNNNTMIFTGNPISLEKIQNILKTIDLPHKKLVPIEEETSYYIYKLQNINGNIIQQNIDSLISKLKSQDVKNPALIEALDSIKLIKETNSILITSTLPTIEEVKKIIAQYDIPRKGKSEQLQDEFFIYKPSYLTVPQLDKSIKDLSNNLEKANLADPNLLNSINSMQHSENSNSIIFTGSKDSLEKIKNLLSTLDVASAKSLFNGKASVILVYKIKQAPPEQLISSIQSLTNDLEKTSNAEKSFLGSLKSMKYEKQTKSLSFTGNEEVLSKIKTILEKFDISSNLNLKLHSDFFIYKPQHLTGASLEHTLKEFADHLRETGFDNADLFESIDSVKYIEKTNSLIFAGDDKSLLEIKNLLISFDAPSKGEISVNSLNKTHNIDNTSFLVYKLQYHKGNEIQVALKQVAAEFAQNPNISPNLLSSINSIQWIQVTNSLLCSGEHTTITRLKEIIKSLDIPLKQVFIEILVLETNFHNLLSFGLNWGMKSKYKDKFTTSMSNFSPNLDKPFNDGTFGSALQSINEATTPKGIDIPFNQQFDLGIIGDIILHKGRSFLSLGSLLSALENDYETSIVMTPKILMQDGKLSNIFIGRNLPYVGSTVTNNAAASSSTIQTQSLEYKDVGMNLTITPVIGDEDMVTLDIKLEKSSVATDYKGEVIQTPGTPHGITTSKTNMSTTVHVPDKSFLILSGNITDQKFRDKAGFPCLGGLPLIGAAFSQTDKSIQRDNLVIFLRPHVINSYKDIHSLSEAQEDLFRENAGTPGLERDFDESTELIKSVNVMDDDDSE